MAFLSRESLTTHIETSASYKCNEVFLIDGYAILACNV